MRAASWLTVDAAVATNHARFVNAPGADRIPNALEDAASLGVTVTAALDRGLKNTPDRAASAH